MDEFARFEALSFDCYGTLIDWETGLAAELVPWALRHGLPADEEELLSAIAAIESVVEQERPTALYPDVLAEVLRRIGGLYGIDVPADEAAAFGGSVGRWPAFPDTPDALAQLKSRFALIVLSNVDRASFAASNQLLGVDFDLVVTAQDVGAYKPSPTSFATLLSRADAIGIHSDALLHVAQSLYHDHEPAQRAGLPTVWIDRRHGKPGFGATPAPAGADVKPDWRFTSLAEFADACVPSA